MAFIQRSKKQISPNIDFAVRVNTFRFLVDLYSAISGAGNGFRKQR